MWSILVLVALLMAVSEGQQEGGEPFKLDYANFGILVINRRSGEVLSENPWLLKFYAPWCHHCKAMEPVWRDLYSWHRDKLNFGIIDCTHDDSKHLCLDFEIEGYPELIYLPSKNEPDNRQFYRYEGPKTVAGIEAFAVEQNYKNMESHQIRDIPKRLSGFPLVMKFVHRFRIWAH